MVTKTSFSDHPLDRRLLKALEEAGFQHPTAVQEKTIPAALEGQDLVVCAPTGTGKTAAYLLPILDSVLAMGPPLRFRPRALIIVPTRELAEQVATMHKQLAKHAHRRCAAIFGGVDIRRQDAELEAAPDILVATPGRLLEHLSRGGLKLSAIEFLVLDEADRLLDPGFLPDVRRIVDGLPDRRQTMLFSATLPPEMDQLAKAILVDARRVQVGSISPREQIREVFYPVVDEQKLDLLRLILSEVEQVEKAIIFARTKKSVAALAPLIREVTGLQTAELHADLSQAERLATLADFREGSQKLLVATDVAARGLDIDGLSHVINFNVPNTPDDYIHRVGRTGRLDREGVAITLVSPEEQALASAIEFVVRRPIQTGRIAGFPYVVPEEQPVSFAPRKNKLADFRDKPKPGVKKLNPFTRGGDLKREFQDPSGEERPKRNTRKRLEKRLRNKKLPHQRKK